MSKNKLRRIAENETFDHLFQPSAQEMFEREFHLKGKWNENFFKNEHPITVEIGCGKGEYTVGLARKNKNKNYIGIDIKGPRLWRGSKTVKEEQLKNVAFIRNKIEFLSSFFSENEISELWITFPDPQIRKIKKRLTSARFLNIYKTLLKPNGIIHLKTDSKLMFDFTNEILSFNQSKPMFAVDNLYNSQIDNEVTQIKTFYEQKFLNEGIDITYMNFILEKEKKYTNPEEK
jgi:tRNA (guanine-N7-)-methyltransferase